MIGISQKHRQNKYHKQRPYSCTARLRCVRCTDKIHGRITGLCRPLLDSLPRAVNSGKTILPPRHSNWWTHWGHLILCGSDLGDSPADLLGRTHYSIIQLRDAASEPRLVSIQFPTSSTLRRASEPRLVFEEQSFNFFDLETSFRATPRL